MGFHEHGLAVAGFQVITDGKAHGGGASTAAPWWAAAAHQGCAAKFLPIISSGELSVLDTLTVSAPSPATAMDVQRMCVEHCFAVVITPPAGRVADAGVPGAGAALNAAGRPYVPVNINRADIICLHAVWSTGPSPRIIE